MNAPGRLGLVSLVLALVACSQAPGASPSPTPSAPAGLAGRQFLSLSVALAGANFPLVPNTRIRLTFSDSNGLSANAGCNTIGGTYAIDGDRLVLSGASMTEMGCQPQLMAQDDWLIAILGSSPRFTLVGDALTLFSGDTVIDLLDREVAEPDQPLVGRTWNLVSIISGEVVSSVPIGIGATLEFSDDGSVAIHFGCNSGGGRYTVDGDSITFSEVVTTEIACAGAAGQVEQAVVAVIGAASIAFAIDADSLALSAGDAGLQYSTTPNS